MVGHAVCNDFRVLDIPHPKEDVRDTSWSKTLKIQSGYPQMGGVSLKKLSSALLGKCKKYKNRCRNVTLIQTCNRVLVRISKMPVQNSN